MANKDGKPFGYHKKKYVLGKGKLYFANPVKNHVVQDKNAELDQLARPEELVACAIIRGGEHHSYGFRSHAEIRSRIGDTDAYDQKQRPADTEGFMTSHGRFVTRQEAKVIAEEAGQCQSMRRELLSSDILWPGER